MGKAGNHGRFAAIAFFCLLISPLMTSSVAAQNKQSPLPAWKQDTIIRDDVFRKYSNWISGGGGSAINNHINNTQFTGGLDYNFHLHRQYYQFGLLVSGDQFGSYNNYQFHLCYGKRHESGTTNFSYFAGLSFSEFNPPYGNGYAQNANNGIGIYFNAEYILKVTYDVGLGVSAFCDINTNGNLLGARLNLFFCGSYKGKKEVYY
jgi:hypothetical protein